MKLYIKEFYKEKFISYLYCPYVPIIQTPVIFESDLTLRKGFLTKYGHKILSSGAKFYGRINDETIH